MIRYPGPGCLVEFMHGDRAQLAMILEEQSGQLRVYTMLRREMRLPAHRLLPWSGPHFDLPAGKQEIQGLLESAHLRREALTAEIDPVYLWEVARGEIRQASAHWFAELLWQNPDFDRVAACGQALLDCKTHFKFQGQEFEILSEEKVRAKLHEGLLARERAETLLAGRILFPVLWDAFRKNQIPVAGARLTACLAAFPAEPQMREACLERLETLLYTRLREPDDHESASLWRELAKSMPDSPHLPLHLLEAWGKTPPHYNFELDRIGYQTGSDWFAPYSGQLEGLLAQAEKADLPALDLPFVSVDTQETEDFDDAFHLEKDASGNYSLHLAIACPAAVWPFGSELDKTILRRASSLYLPENTLHMLPEAFGSEGMSLKAGRPAQAMVARFCLSPQGEVLDFQLEQRRVNVQANLVYEDCEAALALDISGPGMSAAPARADDNPALACAAMLREAYQLAMCLQSRRVEQGAVIVNRPEPCIRLHPCNELGKKPVRVEISPAPAAERAQMLIGEFMVLLNGEIARKALEWELPLIFRTQDVPLPKDYAGVWSRPEEIARVVKHLLPACIDHVPRPHTGLGLAAYATISSPLRRYTDLFNQGQVLHYLEHGRPRWSKEDLAGLLPLIAARSDAVAMIQKQRPRYWKLVYFRQNGDKQWYEAAIAEENDLFVTVNLQEQGFLLRGKRQLFGEKIMPGQLCAVRIGKVRPLENEIQIVAVEEY